MRKSLALVLCMVLCLSAMIGSFGTIAEATASEVNLVSGLTPITFSAALSYSNLRDGDNNLQLRYFPVSGSYMNGYTPDKTDNKATWSSYVSKLTDGNDSSDGVGFRYYADAYNGSHWTAVIFEFDEAATVNSFVIKTSGQAASSGQDVHVFVSNTYAGLFNDDNKVYQGANAATISASNINKEASYFAFYTQDTDFTVYEISVYGEVEQQEADGNNLISGQFPILFAASTGLGNVQSYNFNSTLRYWGVSGVYKNGYTPTDETTKSEWIADRESNAALSEHRLSYLTDNNSSTYMGIQPYSSGQWSVVAYKFDPAIISSLSILSQEKNDYSQRIVVYISDSYNTLLTTESIVYGGDGDEQTWATEINIDSINQEGSYIAIATKERGFSIREIAVYGETIPEVDINAGYSDILTSSQLPIQFSAANSLSKLSIYNDRTLRYFPVSDTWYNGYTPENTETKSTWSSQLALLTDDDDETGMPLRSRYEDNYTVIAYNFSAAKIKGFSIKASDTSGKSLRVYVANSYTDLFSENSLVYSGNTADSMVNPSTLSVAGTYIAFVTQDRDFTINEISVYGVWMDLVKEKAPVALYPVYDDTTKYSFAYVLVGSEETAYRYGMAKPEEPPTSSAYCVSEIGKLNDADDTTYATFKNASIKDEDNNNGNAHDIALIYKLAANANIEKVTVSGVSGENKIGGAKFYLSRSYASLFHQNNFAGEYAGGGYYAALDVDADNNTLYVGIIIRIISTGYKSIKLSNISILGESIEKEAGYGDTLTAANAPANANANQSTKMFYDYLKHVGNSENVLLGAHINEEADTLVQASNEDNYYDYLARKSGLTPSIYSTRVNTQSIESYVECYEQGSVPLIMCLFASKMPVFQDLVDAGDDSSINYMVKYLDKTYTPSSSERTLANTANSDFWDMVEDLGDFLEDLEEAGVETYIISPFNEMNMYGFYGNKNHTEIIDRFINVWRQVYDYLVNERELKGVLFALRPTGSHAAGTYRANPYRYYPGDNYVDIIAPTVYSGEDNGVLDTFDGYSDFVATGKVIGLSETGLLSASNVSATANCSNFLNSLKTTYSAAAFASLWYGYRFDIYQHSNTSVLLDGDYVLTVETMHDYRHYNVPEFTGKAPDDVMKRKVSLIGSAVKTVNFDSQGDYALEVSKDFSGARMIELDVYVQNSAISTLSLELAGLGGSATYTFTGLTNGWNHLAVRIEDATSTEGDLNLSSVTGYTLSSTANAKVYAANLYAADYIDGDANRDGAVDILDLIRAKKMASSNTVKGNRIAVAEDGNVQADDIAGLCQDLLNN